MSFDIPLEAPICAKLCSAPATLLSPTTAGFQPYMTSEATTVRYHPLFKMAANNNMHNLVTLIKRQVV